MRFSRRSAVALTAAGLMLASGAGSASAQSLQFTLPEGFGSLSLVFPGLAGPGGTGPAPTGTAAAAAAPALPVTMPAELAEKAFEGRVVAAVNEARIAVGTDRLVTDPTLEASADDRAAQLAQGDPTTGELTVPESASQLDRTVLDLPAGATPQTVLTTMLSDTGMRERMLDGRQGRVGIGMATAADGRVHVVVDFGPA